MSADELNINQETIRETLHDVIRKRRMCAKLVAQRLTDEGNIDGDGS
jgi:hypothetical protein